MLASTARMPILPALRFVEQSIEFSPLLVVENGVDSGLTVSQHVFVVVGEVAEDALELFGLLGGQLKLPLQAMDGDILARNRPERGTVQSFVYAEIHGQCACYGAGEKHQQHRHRKGSPGTLYAPRHRLCGHGTTARRRRAWRASHPGPPRAPAAP